MAARKKTANSVAKAFGVVLRETRVRAGVSQEALALTCEIDRTYISLLERGLRQPTLSTLLTLAHALKETPEGMVSGTVKVLAH